MHKYRLGSCVVACDAHRGVLPEGVMRVEQVEGAFLYRCSLAPSHPERWVHAHDKDLRPATRLEVRLSDAYHELLKQVGSAAAKNEERVVERFTVGWPYKREEREAWAAAGVPLFYPTAFVRQYEREAMRNHGQTIDRLNERGGLSLFELACLVSGRTLARPEAWKGISDELRVVEAAFRRWQEMEGSAAAHERIRVLEAELERTKRMHARESLRAATVIAALDGFGFPDVVEGSAGWSPALERVRRLLATPAPLPDPQPPVPTETGE